MLPEIYIKVSVLMMTFFGNDFVVLYAISHLKLSSNDYSSYICCYLLWKSIPVTYLHILIYLYQYRSLNCVVNAVCRFIPLDERSRAVSFVFGGLSVGSVAGYVLMNFLLCINFDCFSWYDGVGKSVKWHIFIWSLMWKHPLWVL